MKKLLIITGPQGSGNHLFSRVFSTHPKVGGWKNLLDKYWVPSDEEYFAKYWVYPEELTEKDFAGYDYWLANVSCPFFYDGVRYVPKIKEVAEKAESFGIGVQIAIIVRDSNINSQQQLRVRGEITIPIAQEYYYNTLIPSGFKVHFLDNEAFFLHKEHYLKWVSELLDFPVDYDNQDIFKFIDEDPNKKYVNYVEEYWLDQEVWNGIMSKKDRENLKIN
jgi:hypothetical protein